MVFSLLTSENSLQLYMDYVSWETNLQKLDCNSGFECPLLRGYEKLFEGRCGETTDEI